MDFSYRDKKTEKVVKAIHYKEENKMEVINWIFRQGIKSLSCGPECAILYKPPKKTKIAITVGKWITNIKTGKEKIKIFSETTFNKRFELCQD